MAHAEGITEAEGVEGNPKPLNYKTWVLKVSIHCEACKKKVNKILHKIEGVCRTDIDLKQQRVTVTGNVEAETLISRIEKKTGKCPTLLLPDKAAVQKKAATNEKKQQTKPEPKEPPHSISNNADRNNGGEAPMEDGEVKRKTECLTPVDESGSKAASRTCEEKGPGKEAGAGEVKGSSDDKDNAEEEIRPVPEKPAAANSEGGGSGNCGKKKKPRGQNGNGENKMIGGQKVSTKDEQSTVPHQKFDGNPYSGSYAIHHYHGPPALSYHTWQPMIHSGSSHYAPQPPPTYYAYSHPGQGSEHVPPYLDVYSVHQSDSFEMFSDENPNACLIM
ncbi:hypothetical protein SAY86_012744 [Trapa natans]|uniref:HMA domain-containing protein n=1 Tax=Trapa natans TaxID=22666 RepID=A0AAN7RAY2_TRANT|nr:hypothetical protein SAY86_012744 [Trapa natans]